jgi:tRNA-dihydrouridine synthase
MFARGAMGNPFIFSEAKSLLLNGSYVTPPASERILTGFRQLKLLCEDAGEAVACREMRKQFCAYTKGVAGGAAIREHLVRAETVEDYRRILSDAELLAPTADSA